MRTIEALIVTAAMAFTSLVAEPETVQVQDAPNSWSLTWSAKGAMIGPFEIGLRVHDGNVIIASAQAPPGAQCNTIWNWRFPATGSFTSFDDGDCSNMRNSHFDIVVRRNGSAWTIVNEFTLFNVAPQCCSNPPPQNCSGQYSPGTLSAPCF